MTESLGLSEDQATAIEKAMVVKITEIRALKVKFADNKDEFKKAAQPIREQFQTTVKNTLSEEQFKKLQELRKERVQDPKTKKGNKPAKRAIKAHPEK